MPHLEAYIRRVKNSRRKFLIRLSVTLSSIGAALVAVPSIGFLLGLRKSPQVWRTVGKLDDFKIGSTVNVSFQDLRHCLGPE